MTRKAKPRCKCGDWLNIDICMRLAAWIVDSELVEKADEGDLALECARFAANLCGLTNADVSRVRSLGLHKRQRELVDEYIRFIATTNDSHRRSAFLREIGVSQSTMARWARKHLGRQSLVGKGPRPAWAIAKAALLEHGPMSYNDVARVAGLPHRSITAVLLHGVRKKEISRRKDADGRYTYYAE